MNAHTRTHMCMHAQTHTNTNTHTTHARTIYTYTCIQAGLTTQQMPPSPAPIMASTMTRAVSPTASGMYWAAAGRRGGEGEKGGVEEHQVHDASFYACFDLWATYE